MIDLEAIVLAMLDMLPSKEYRELQVRSHGDWCEFHTIPFLGYLVVWDDGQWGYSLGGGNGAEAHLREKGAPAFVYDEAELFYLVRRTVIVPEDAF